MRRVFLRRNVNGNSNVQERADELLAGLEFEDRCEAALDEFIKLGGDETAPYFTGAVAYLSADKVTRWGIDNLPYGVNSLTSPSAFQIAFNNVKGTLVRDPDWKPTREIYRDLEARLTAVQFKQLYNGEMPVLRTDLASDLEKIGGLQGFKNFVDGKVA